MLTLYFFPGGVFRRELAHQPDGQLVLDTTAIQRPRDEVAQHPSISLAAGFDPQTATLKPRHFRFSPVTARETAEQSVAHGSRAQKPVLTAGIATLGAPRPQADRRAALRGEPVPGHDVGAVAETCPPRRRPRTVLGPCWASAWRDF